MQKTKILFVMSSMKAGGAEKALVNLLSAMDSQIFDISLQLFYYEGLYLDMIPDYVKLLPPIPEYEAITAKYPKMLRMSLRLHKPQIIFKRISTSLKLRSVSNLKTGYRRQITGKANVSVLPHSSESYDVAVGYIHGASFYYVMDRVTAKKKITWVHNDFALSGFDIKFEIPYYRRVDRIAVVSNENLISHKAIFPEFASKMSAVYSIVSKKLLKELAGKFYPEEYIGFDGVKLLTVGRFTYQKGYDIAIDAGLELKNRGVDFKWYIIGAGELEEEIKQLAEEKGVSDRFVFLGLRQNPYPYFANSDIYVQSSRFEGYGIAIQEARLLCVPTAVTNFTIAKDQITDGENGLITDMDGVSLACGIERLIDDSELYNKIRSNLSSEKDTLDSLQTHYELFSV